MADGHRAGQPVQSKGSGRGKQVAASLKVLWLDTA